MNILLTMWAFTVFGFSLYPIIFPVIIDTTPVVHVEKILPHKTVMARITCYGPTGYNMANTKPPTVGWVAVSDRTIPFNTVIEVDSIKYKVGDRTAKWVRDDFKVLTVDIFMSTGCDKYFGNKIKEVKIYAQK